MLTDIGGLASSEVARSMRDEACKTLADILGPKLTQDMAYIHKCFALVAEAQSIDSSFVEMVCFNKAKGDSVAQYMAHRYSYGNTG